MRPRFSPIVVALFSASACGGNIAGPSPAINLIEAADAGASNEVDASAASDDAATRGDAADAVPVDAAPDASDAACEYGVDGFTLPDLDTACFDGPTGRQLLALLVPSYASTFVPSGPPYGTTWTGSLAPSALTMTFAYTAGTITCKPQPPHDCGLPQWPTACGCPDPEFFSLDVEVAATFQTADGAFNEQLSATASLSWQPGYVTWTAALPAHDLQGTYPPMFGATETFDFQGTLGPTAPLAGTVVETKGQRTGGGGAWGM